MVFAFDGTAGELAALVGPLDENLRQIENGFDVTVSRRGSHFRVTGVRAAQALGMSMFQTVLWIIVPQAARRALPGCGNEIVYLIKYSSLAYLVTCMELMGEGKVIASNTFRYMEVFLVVGAYYLIMVTLASWLLRWLERRFAIPGFGTH